MESPRVEIETQPKRRQAEFRCILSCLSLLSNERTKALAPRLSSRASQATDAPFSSLTVKATRNFHSNVFLEAFASACVLPERPKTSSSDVRHRTSREATASDAASPKTSSVLAHSLANARRQSFEPIANLDENP